MSFIRMATAVPLSDIGEAPGFYSPSIAVLVTGITAMITIILFVTNSLASNALARLDINPLPRVLISAGIMIAVVVTFVLVAVHDQNAHKEDVAAHRAARVEAHDRAVIELELHYGVDLDDYAIPIAPRPTRSIEVTRPDQTTASCLIRSATGHYEIRCGSDRWDDATPLPPAEQGDRP